MNRNLPPRLTDAQSAGEKGGKPEQGSSLQLAFHGRLDDFEVFGQSERKISFEVPRPAHHFRQQAVRK